MRLARGRDRSRWRLPAARRRRRRRRRDAPAPVIRGRRSSRGRSSAATTISRSSPCAPGETLASLAERYLGDPGKAWWIAQFNNITTVRAGQTIVVPLRMRNPLGVYASGYQTIPILCYHRFGASGRKLNVTPAAFEQQMEYLARNGYTVITLPRLARFLDGKERCRPSPS